MYPHPYLQTLLRIMGQEDPRNDSDQVEGEVCNLEIQEDERTISGSLNAIGKKIQEDERQEVGGSPQRGACPHSVQGARRQPCRSR